MYLADFRETGRKLAESGLVSGASGNLSVRINNHLLITTHGSQLGRLNPADIIEAGIDADEDNTSKASFELPVHRAIYLHTTARAIVHAHPPHATALSLKDAAAIKAPVLGEGGEIIPGVLALEIATTLTVHPLVMVRGHGSFATGKTLAEALQLTLAFEDECDKPKSLGD